jgi:Flp pilus assembly protein TadG
VAVELALCAPVLLAIVVLLVEGGRALAYGAAIEKGLRAGAMYVARAPLPIAPETATAVENLVKRGTVDAVGPYLVPGWDDPGATVTVTRLADYVTHGVAVPVFRVTASVPFAPILPYFPAFAISLSHEQAYVGR